MSKELPMDKYNETVYLYLCDGKACLEKEKTCCYTQCWGDGMECRHTSDKSHAINPDNTNWYKFGNSNIMVEREKDSHGCA